MAKSNAHMWLVEPLMEHPSFIEKRMFGCRACYLHGLLVLVLADGDQPWNGIMVATSKEHHAKIQLSFPTLTPHPVLGKWLYLSAERDDFERVAKELVKSIANQTPLIGVPPGAPRKVRAKRKKQRSRS